MDNDMAGASNDANEDHNADGNANVNVDDDVDNDIESELRTLVTKEINANYGREDGELSDTEVDEMMKPIYDDHDGNLLMCYIDI